MNCSTFLSDYILNCLYIVFVAHAKSPTPPSSEPSKLLHVNHLTRPYSRVQLFELLSADAPLVQDHFWTDHIKSHCIALVRYRLGKSGLKQWLGRCGVSCWVLETIVRHFFSLLAC